MEIAERLGIPYTTLKNYVSGRRDFPVEVLIQIANLTNCSLNWLLIGTGPKFVQVEIEENDENAKDLSDEVRAIVHQELARVFRQFAQAQSAQTVITNTTNANFRFTNQR